MWDILHWGSIIPSIRWKQPQYTFSPLKSLLLSAAAFGTYTFPNSAICQDTQKVYASHEQYQSNLAAER
ncbi:hypothetical protein CHS0354_028609, partial [Potamilus streckersoni]